MGCCQSCSGFAIQTVLSLLCHFYTWLKRQMKSFKIAFWRPSRVCGSVCGGVDTRSTRKESHTDSRIRSEMHSAKGNGTSLQSATANCRLQKEQHFKTNSILGMPLPTQDLPIPAILTTTKDLTAIMTIAHSDTVKLGYVTCHFTCPSTEPLL